LAVTDRPYIRLYNDTTGRKLLAQCPYEHRELVKLAGARWDQKVKIWWWPTSEFEDVVWHLKKQNVRVTGPTDLAERLVGRTLEIADGDAIRSGLCSSADKREDDYADLPTYLYDHQKVALRLAQRFDQYAFFMDTGTGKTPLGIEIAKRNFVDGRILIVCPLSIIKPAWGVDLERFGDGITYALAYQSRRQRLEAINSPADVVVINYESFRLLIPEITAAGPWSCLILDESSKIKNPNTEVALVMNRFAHTVPKRYILSATPAPNKQTEFFSQMRIVDRNLLGDGYTSFRCRYFHRGFDEHSWEITDQNHNILMGHIRQRAQFVDKNDCLDLPGKVFLNRVVPMYLRQKTIYNNLVRTCRTMVDDGTITAASALTQIMKLRQVTSGFVLDDLHAVRWCDSPKYKELDSVLDELSGRSVVVWVNFHAEIDALLKRYGDRCRAIYGQVPTGERAEIISQFQAGQFQILVAHPRTAGHGITLTAASTAVYFSLSYSLEEYYQSMDRIHRIGQTSKCTYIHLLCEDTIDQRLLEVLQSKESVSKAALGFLK
jgi:SNF2 family DNA or RNA helicase